ncbi:MAG: cysteine desulfurase NifS [Verrucomicrobia bacterium]|nr:cysteine desulfurase NifS [Verrucomicrobiota bacterium]
MNEKKTIYLDNNATTQVAPEVVEAMVPFLSHYWGNPSSAYEFGHRVMKPLESARRRVAELINCDPREIVFTSCGTESNNAAIHSSTALSPGKRHIVTTAVEHSAILNFCKFLKQGGCEVTCLPVEPDGSLDLHLLEKALRPDTAIVSVMWANNETGVIFPVEEISAICRSKGVLFHTDAIQVPGKLPIDVREVGMDFLSLSGHKLHAPKGIGVLYIKRGLKFQPYIIGGHQERGRRGGTENVAGIVAFGRAAELAMERMREERPRILALRAQIEEGILGSIPDSIRNGGRDTRLSNTSNIGFEGVEAEAVLMMLDQAGICASSGSACTTGSLEPSHVLTAMGIRPSYARGSVRFSLGACNTQEDVDYLLEVLPGIIRRLRGESPIAPPSHETPQVEFAEES